MTTATDARDLIARGFTAEDGLAERCCCGAARETHSGGKHTGGNLDTGCERYRRDVADRLATRALTNARTHPLHDVGKALDRAYPRPRVDKEGWGVGPSDAGNCRKRIQLRERPPADLIPDEADHTAADLGSMFHDAILRARAVLYPWRLYEFPVDVPGLDRRGRIDQYDPVLAKVTDLKTNSPYSWEALGLNGPYPEHWDQVLIYGLALRAAGRPVEYVELEYINRGTGDTEPFVRRYDQLTAENALNRLIAINVALDMGQELPRDRSGPTGKHPDIICSSYCETRSYCWGIPAATAAGRSPESYTILGVAPNIEEITWAAENVWGWKENFDEADREYNNARKLLRGIPDGEYGDYVVKTRSRKMPDWKGYGMAVKRAIADGATADEIDMINVPIRIDSWVEVKPVRAAKREKGAA